MERLGLRVYVCTPERAFVDCLDRLDLSPDLDTLWDLFCAHDDFDQNAMIDHALRLQNRVTCARLGLFLRRHPVIWRPTERIRELLDHRPKTAALMDSARFGYRDCLFYPEWNLLVPARLYHRLMPRR
jgi:predicted transcriptional regulator of viral defense system